MDAVRLVERAECDVEPLPRIELGILCLPCRCSAIEPEGRAEGDASQSGDVPLRVVVAGPVNSRVRSLSATAPIQPLSRTGQPTTDELPSPCRGARPSRTPAGVVWGARSRRHLCAAPRCRLESVERARGHWFRLCTGPPPAGTPAVFHPGSGCLVPTCFAPAHGYGLCSVPRSRVRFCMR